MCSMWNIGTKDKVNTKLNKSERKLERNRITDVRDVLIGLDTGAQRPHVSSDAMFGAWQRSEVSQIKV